MSESEYFYYGQGKLSVAIRNSLAGTIGLYQYAGDVSTLTLKPTVEMIKHRESNSGQNSLVRNIAHTRDLNIDITFAEFRPSGMARDLYGNNVSVAAGSVTAETLPDALVAGDEVRLANPAVSAVVITDSTGTPLTLVEGTDYTVDANFGKVTILNVGTYVQPFKAAYSYGKRTDTGILTSAQPDIALLYEGVNLAENNAPVICELYKVAPAVAQEIMLITTGTDTAGRQVAGAVLLDSLRESNGPLGQFGRITQVGV